MTYIEINNTCKNIINSKKDIHKTIEINKIYILECLKNIKENYYTLYYSILFQEEKIMDLIDPVIISLILNIEECNPVNKILEITPIITDFTAIEMIDKITDKEFDYKYHILKRKEISDYIKENILEEFTIEEINDYIDNIKPNNEEKIYVRKELEKYKIKRMNK
ncbi:MAG: hypothetical protein J6K21_00945 [Bacilli bacterium]|nr:hypothetical protein [Bacilli bacterium]